MATIPEDQYDNDTFIAEQLKDTLIEPNKNPFQALLDGDNLDRVSFPPKSGRQDYTF
jgi:hypothetical protein